MADDSGEPNSRASGTVVARGTHKRGLTAVGLVTIPKAEVARDPETGRQIALPSDPWSNSDPRTRGDYVENQVRAVVFDPFDPFYLLNCGETSIGIHYRLVDFKKGHWGAASPEIHSTPQRAFDADQRAEFLNFLTPNPPQSRGTVSEAFASLKGRREFYSFYQARSGNNSYTLPTRFNPDSAPRTVELVKRAIEMKIDQVTTDLEALKSYIVWQGVSRLVFTIASAALPRFSVPLKARTLRESVPAETPSSAAPTLATKRPFLSAAEIIEMRAKGVKVYAYRTPDLDLVQNREIKLSDGRTNPNYKNKIALVSGYRGVNYGPYTMVIKADDLPVPHNHVVSGGEFYITEPIPASKGYWTTAAEVEKAFAKK